MYNINRSNRQLHPVQITKRSIKNVNLKMLSSGLLKLK